MGGKRKGKERGGKGGKGAEKKREGKGGEGRGGEGRDSPLTAIPGLGQRLAFRQLCYATNR